MIISDSIHIYAGVTMDQVVMLAIKQHKQYKIKIIIRRQLFV